MTKNTVSKLLKSAFCVLLLGSALVLSSCSRTEKPIAGVLIGAGAVVGIGAAIGGTGGAVAGGLIGAGTGAVVGHSLGDD